MGSVCIVPVFVPKVKAGEQAVVPKVELGEQRVKPSNMDIFENAWICDKLITPGGGGGGGGGYSPNMVNVGVPLKWVTFFQKIPKHAPTFAEKIPKHAPHFYNFTVDTRYLAIAHFVAISTQSVYIIFLKLKPLRMGTLFRQI